MIPLFVNKNSRTKVVRSIALNGIIAILMYFVSGLFLQHKAARLLSLVFSTFFIAKAVERFLDARAVRLSREQCELLLQYLSTETSSGRSLDTAFAHAPEHFARLYSQKSPFLSGLEQIAAGLRLQMPLHLLIRDFASTLQSQEARIVLQVLTTIDFGGSDLPEVLHQESRILGDMKRIERQVAAENAQQSSEAMILCLLPFFAMLALRTAAASYMEASFESLLGQGILAASYLLALLALFLNIHFRADSPSRSYDESLLGLKRYLLRPSFLKNLATKLLNYLPNRYVLRLYNATRVLWTLRSEDGGRAHSYEAGLEELNVALQMKLLWLIVAMPLGIAAWQLGLPWFYILAIIVIIPFMQDQELLSRANRYQNELMQSLPLFVALMNQLLRSGMVVQRALLFTIREMPQDSPLQKELRLLESSISSGQNASHVLSEFSSRLDIPEAQTALLMLARQETHGGHEMLRQLDQASKDCWSILGSAYRRRYELLSQRMFIPMILDMFSIVLMSAAPAVLMFMGA